MSNKSCKKSDVIMMTRYGFTVCDVVLCLAEPEKVTLLIILVSVILVSSIFTVLKQKQLLQKNAQPKLLKYYQTFPIERYPGLKCYVIATDERLLVSTQNCDIVLVQKENITINNIVIPRQSAERCNRCYLSDYLSVLGLLLFGRPDHNISALAPNGLLLLEDDTVVCNSALPVLDKCHNEQYNCLLGNGACMNYYAGPTTNQPHPELYHSKRFVNNRQLYQSPRLKREPHADWYIRYHEKHVVREELTNHMGKSSTLNHENGEVFHCSMEDSLAHTVATVPRYREVKTHVWF